MLRNSSFVGRAAILLIIAGSMAMAVPVFAQGSDPVVVLLDRHAICTDQQPTAFSPADVNAPIATVGLRDALPYFARHASEEMTLPGGAAGAEGWFALTSVPAAWATDESASDGAQNFVFAGPGLGSPDEAGSRSTLLASVPGVTALGEEALATLAGHRVCGVVYDQVLAVGEDGSTDLSGANLGLVGLQVVGSGGGQVQVQILNVNDVCRGSLSIPGSGQ